MLDRISSFPGIRSIAVLLSTSIVVVLLFGMLLIQARSDLVLRRQQADFGEVARMASLLRDLGDTLTMNVSRNGQGDRQEANTAPGAAPNPVPGARWDGNGRMAALGLQPRGLAGEREYRFARGFVSADRFQVDVAGPGAERDWCTAMAAGPTALQLSMGGFQRRDRKPIMAAFVMDGGKPRCAQSSAQSAIRGVGGPGRARELAITGPNGDVLLVLRGDWPSRIIPANGKAAPPSGTKPGQDVLLQTDDTGNDTPTIEIGGRERLVYQWPLDFGRRVTIQRDEGAVVCAPRQCSLSTLSDPPGAGAVLNNLSPFTKATFGFAVVVLLLLIPLIKLASIDHNASLGWMDVIGIIAAIPLMVATLVTACAIIYFWTDLRRDNDNLARGLGMAVAQDIDREVGLSLGAIEGKAARRWASDSRPGSAIAAGDDDAGSGAAWRPNPSGGAGGAWQTSPPPLPLTLLQLRNFADGKILDQLPTSDKTPTDIRERRYFGRLRNGDTIPCDNPAANGKKSGGFGCNAGHAYIVDQVPAAATGDSRMVLLLAEANGDDSFLMAGKPPAATLSVPVPDGFGYAVIDPVSLEVLQHSDPSRAHNEKFDSQLDAVDTLVKAATSVNTRCGLADKLADKLADNRNGGLPGGAGKGPAAPAAPSAAAPSAAAPPASVTFNARYSGNRVRMSIGVACSARWLVATWYDRSRLQNMALEPAYVAGVSMLCTGVLLALILSFMAWADARLLLRKLWPDPEPFHNAESAQWYRRGLLPQVLVAGLMFLGLFVAKGDAAFLHGLLGLFLLLILLARKDANHGWGEIPVQWGRIGALFYAGTGILASIVLFLTFGADWRSFSYPVLVVLMGGIAMFDWFVSSGSRFSLPAWLSLPAWFPLPTWLSVPTETPGFVPPSVMQRLNRVLRHQAVAIYLLAVIPALAAFCAGTGQVRADRSLLDSWLVAQAQDRGTALIGQMAVLYDSPLADPPVPADLSARKLVADHVVDNPGIPSFVASAVTRLWGPDRPLVVDRRFDLGTARFERNAVQAQQMTGNPVVSLPTSETLIVMRDWLAIVGATGIAGFLIYRLLLLAARNLFGLQHFGFRALHPRHTPEQIRATSTGPIKAVFINYPYREFRKLQRSLDARDRLEMFDLTLERSNLGEKSMALLTAKSWIITGFESIVANRDLRLRTLGLLEQLTARPEVNVYFFVQTMPLVRLRQTRDREKREAEAAGAAGVMNESESYRWAELFSEFITYTWTETLAEPAPAEEATDPPRGGPNLERLLELIDEPNIRLSVRRWAARNPAAAEAVAKEMIQVPSDRIQDQIRSFGISLADISAKIPRGEPGVLNDLNDVYREQIHEYMANFLGDYYQGEWVRSSKEEHLTLHHLAHGKFINTSNFPVLNSLLSRRLIKTDPDFRLMNESFGHWIRTLEHPDWFYQFSRDAQSGGAWSMLRVPLLLLVAAGSVLVTFLDHDGSGSLLTLIPGAVATVPILLSRFTRPPQANT